MLNNRSLSRLPTDSEIVQMVGEKPLVVGDFNYTYTPGIRKSVESSQPDDSSCTVFAKRVPRSRERLIGIAGLFNTGTNLLSQLLRSNCKMPAGRIRANVEVPWGKHSYATNWDKRSAKGYARVEKENVLAVVMTRDPYTWSRSMCRNPYIVEYDTKRKAMARCPNLSNVTVWGAHDNILHFWNLWYQKYVYDFPNPRIIVRMEDLTLRPKETVQHICNCAGGYVRKLGFQHAVGSAKKGQGHGDAKHLTGMITAWTKLRRPKQPRGGLSMKEYQIAVESIDKRLMDLFGYQHPPDITGNDEDVRRLEKRKALKQLYLQNRAQPQPQSDLRHRRQHQSQKDAMPADS